VAPQGLHLSEIVPVLSTEKAEKEKVQEFRKYQEEETTSALLESGLRDGSDSKSELMVHLGGKSLYSYVENILAKPKSDPKTDRRSGSNTSKETTKGSLRESLTGRTAFTRKVAKRRTKCAVHAKGGRKGGKKQPLHRPNGGLRI